MSNSILHTIRIQLALAVLCAAVGIFGAGCGSGRYTPPPPVPADTLPIPEPHESRYNNIEYLFDRQFTEQIDQTLDFSRLFRRLAGSPKQAPTHAAHKGAT